MSAIATALRHMLAAKMDHAAIVAAVEDMEASLAPAKSARSERNARYYDANRDELRLKASERRLNSTEHLNASEPPAPPCLDKENPPAPPKEINPNPPLPPISVGSPQAKRPAPTNRAPVYHKDFEFLWKDIFPKHPNASKPEAFKRWSQLTDEDRDKCFDGALAYAKFLSGERQKRPDHPALHLATFIHQRRFDSLLEAAQ